MATTDEASASVGADSSSARQILTNLTTVRIIATTILVFVAVNLARLLWQSMQMRWRGEKNLKNFETLKFTPRHWLFGHIALLDPATVLSNLAKEASKAVSGTLQIWLGPFRCYLAIVSPDAIKTILGTAEPKDEYGYQFVKPWVGDGLLISGGKKWQRNRKLLTPAFHFEVLRPYTRIFNDSAMDLVRKWKLACRGKEVSREMFSDISLFTLDSLLKCIFSVESNCQTEGLNHPYIKSVHEMSELVVNRVVTFFHHSDLIYHLSPSGWRWRRAIRTAHAYTRKVIAERADAIGDDGVNKEGATTRRGKYIDFLDILLAAKDDSGKGLSPKEIEDEVDTFMFEGHDTTASGVSWMLYNMARHPEYQQRCREEVDALLEDKEDGRIEWDDLVKLPYLTMCLKESLRLHSPVPMVNRQLERPLSFSKDCVAPPGTSLTIQLTAMHLNDKVWKDPETFDPERFNPENSRTRSSHAFVPFSAGPRNCIGQNFAMNEMKVVVALVLRHFHLKVDESIPVEKFFSVVLRSKNGLHLLLEPREL